jgi:hypothetical protein
MSKFIHSCRPAHVLATLCGVLAIALSLAVAPAGARPYPLPPHGVYQPAISSDASQISASESEPATLSTDASQRTAPGFTAAPQSQDYASFGSHKPLPPASSSVARDDGTSWWAIALGAGVPLLLLVTGLGLRGRRQRRGHGVRVAV